MRSRRVAIDCNADERSALLVERTGKLISDALSDALATVQLSAAERGHVVTAFVTRLQALESSLGP
jgi:hypothetical protein